MTDPTPQQEPNPQSALRWVLAGPGALVLAVLAMASLPSVLPAGAGGVNHFVLPVIAFPLIWATLVVLPVSARRIGKVARVYAGLLLLCMLLIVASFLA